MATTEFYVQKISEAGIEAAAKYAEAAQQTMLAKMIATGFWKPEYHSVSIFSVNDVFKNHGKDAALTFAKIDPEKMAWVIKKIQADQWDPDHKNKNGNGATVAEPEGPAKMPNPPPKYLQPMRRRKETPEEKAARKARNRKSKEMRANECLARAGKVRGAGIKSKKGESGKKERR